MPHDDHYEVGFGKPPKSHQFKKGQSGNPRGRGKTKKGSRTEIIVNALNQSVKVRKGDRSITMTKFEVIIEDLINKAMQGDRSARADLLKLLDKLGPNKAAADQISSNKVLILPGIMDRDEWLRMVNKTQAKARGETPDDEASS